MAHKNLGRVSVVDKGAYDSGTIYRKLDIVRTNNASYLSRIEGNESDISDTDAWMLIAEDGTDINDAYFDGNDLVFERSDGTGVRIENAKIDLKGDKGDNGDVINEWVDKDYEELEKSHKYGIIWEAEEGVAGSDVPGVSTKWKPITQQIKEKEPRNYDKGEIALTPNGEPIVAQRDVTAIENITSTDAFYKVARTNLNTYTFSGTYKN